MRPAARRLAIAIVVATRNRPSELAACLSSIRAGSEQPAELIVVDSASRDARAVAQVVRQAQAQLVRLEQGGAARARNVGARLAQGDVIALTDDDAVVGEGWIEAIEAAFADEWVSAMVGPVFETGGEQRHLLYTRPGFDPAVECRRFSNDQPDWFERAALGAIGFGANLAIRRTALARFGPFRESLGAGAPIGGDENYYILTLLERGGVVVNQPSARVYHPRPAPERLHEVERSIVAYVLYVLFSRPTLRGAVVGRLLRQLREGEIGRPNRSASPGVLARGLVAAPSLLLSAWSIERLARPSADAASPLPRWLAS